MINVAGRDIIQNHLTSVNILQVLETAVRESAAIPEPQKNGLLDQIGSLANNPIYFRIGHERHI